MSYTEKEATQLAMTDMVRGIGLPKDNLEVIVASLLFNYFEGNEIKMLKFITMLKDSDMAKGVR